MTRRVLRPSLVALILALGLLVASVSLGAIQRTEASEALEQSLRNEAAAEVQTLANYFERARSVILLTAQNPAFADFYEEPGRRTAKVRSDGAAISEARAALAYLERLYPESIGEACFIDRGGSENARVVHGRVAVFDDLSKDESANPFFRPTFALDPGDVYQARPYVSPDTGEWVISNSTPVPMADGTEPAIVHYEVTVESFRRAAEAATTSDLDVLVVNANTGSVVLDSSRPQLPGEPLGDKGRIYDGVSGWSRTGFGSQEARGFAYARLPATPGNANDWFVVAQSTVAFGPLSGVGAGPVAMLLTSLLLLALSGTALRSSQRELSRAATTDSLTELGNRRKLMADLERVAQSSGSGAFLVALFDLNGFKVYNDRFGHPAGDALLVRLAGKLQNELGKRGAAYRMGGDEFCAVAPVLSDQRAGFEARLAASLSEEGEGFSVSASFGSVLIPTETREPSEALRIADGRMYAQKQGGRPSAGRQSKDVLLRTLHERSAELGAHVGEVATMAERVGVALGVEGELLEQIRHAAELHDIGKVAVPVDIVNKPGPLTEDESAFMRKHTLIGEKILAAAPSLTGASLIVRSSHERYDGAGYPDGLAGEDIPLGARIVAVCDAFDAMISHRPYRAALEVEEAVAELRACAGGQFDPAVVDVFMRVCLEPLPAGAGAG